METLQTEDEQVEQLRRWWKKNGFSTMVGIAVGIGVVAGWQMWTNYQQQQSSAAASYYQQVINSIKTEQIAQAEITGETLLREYGNTGYATLAALLLARSSVEQQKMQEAQHYLTWVEEHTSIDEYKQIARLRLARLLNQNNDQDGALALLDKGDAGTFSGVYQDLKGDILLKQGKVEAAKTAYVLALTQVQEAGLKQLIKMKLDDMGTE
jgi:predicted negative regulator of RcsB-dependent stress response